MPKETFFNLPEDKRKTILSNAIDEFSANPYHTASISKIVRQSEIAKGSFYQYFDDKRDLYHYLIQISLADKNKLAEQLPPPDTSSDLFGYLRWQFFLAIQFEYLRPKNSQILYRAFIEERIHAHNNEGLEQLDISDLFKPLLRQGILFGNIAPWLDTELGTFILEITYFHMGSYFLNHSETKTNQNKDLNLLDNDEIQQRLDNLMDIIEAGMKRDPEQRRTFYNKD